MASTRRSLGMPQLGLALATGTLGALAGFGLFPGDAGGAGDGTEVAVVDNSEEVAALLRAREGTELPAPSASDVYPPPLRREPLTEERAKSFFPALGMQGYSYDPQLYYRQRGPKTLTRYNREHVDRGWDYRINSLGMREDEEPLEQKPDLRILVAGDSHTGGICPNADSFTNLLEHALTRPDLEVEALNTGLGGYNPYNYLGVVEHYGHLQPDLFIAAVYGGNDFSGMMALNRFFERRPPPKMQRGWRKEFTDRVGTEGGILSQELTQARYFQDNPEDVQRAIDTCASISLEIRRACEALDAELIFVYIPPPLRGQPEVYAEKSRRCLDALGEEPDFLDVSDEIADGWLDFLEQRGIPFVDMRPALRASTAPLYWEQNCHLNIVANGLVARDLEALARELLGI